MICFIKSNLNKQFKNFSYKFSSLLHVFFNKQKFQISSMLYLKVKKKFGGDLKSGAKIISIMLIFTHLD